MNPRTLAKALRRRQLRKGVVPTEWVHRQTDSSVINCYTRCSRCAGELFQNPEAAVRNSQDVNEFLTLAEVALTAHTCKP